MGKKIIHFSPPDVGDDEINEIIDTLRSGWITTGPKTKKFENMIANFCNTRKSACLNSQTAAAELTLRLLGVGVGDEVIVPAYTYTATASVVHHVGATIVMVDCDKNSFEMDYKELETKITCRTKVIIPVDLAGIICDYDKIFKIVERKKHLFFSKNEIQKSFNRVVIMADGAHALGAKRNGKMCGEIADFTNFSFHAVKNLTTGEGGAVTWKENKNITDEFIYNQFMLMSLHGQNKDALAKTKLGSWEYDVIAPYYKCNMTDIAACLGIVQLNRYEETLKRRQEIIKRYDKSLMKFNVQLLTHLCDNSISSGHLYLMRLIGKDSAYRNSFIEKMAEKGVFCNVHYKPLPMLTAYMNLGFNIIDFPNAYDMFKNEVSLPLHTCLTDEQVEYICECVEDLLGE